MNWRCVRRVVVVIKTYKDQVYTIPRTLEQWEKIKDDRIRASKPYYKIWKVNVYFNQICYEEEKVQVKEIEEPKGDTPLMLMGSTQKLALKESNPQKYAEMEAKENATRKKVLEMTEKHRTRIREERGRQEKAIFFEKRKNILSEWEKLEKEYWLETTISKLNEYEKIKKEQQIKILKNEMD